MSRLVQLGLDPLLSSCASNLLALFESCLRRQLAPGPQPAPTGAREAGELVARYRRAQRFLRIRCERRMTGAARLLEELSKESRLWPLVEMAECPELPGAAGCNVTMSFRS